MTRLILYVQNVQRLQSFYQTHFGLTLTEQIPNEWAVLQAGNIEIALHRAGPAWRNGQASGRDSNAKMVFSVTTGLPELRENLIRSGVTMREIKRYDGFAMQMCDGEDPEGNVFQLSQAD